MDLAMLTAKRSKDRSTQVGCVIVLPDKGAQVLGYNGFVRGVDDTREQYHQRPMKYLWTEHAERNAIYNAARNGVRTSGATMYCILPPCVECARAIIQAGIRELVIPLNSALPERWDESVGEANKMMQQVGVLVRYI